MMEGHSGELLVSESDCKSVPNERSHSSKTTRTEADGPGCRNYQVTTHGCAQITTAGVLQNWLTHGDQVTPCNAVQTLTSANFRTPRFQVANTNLSKFWITESIYYGWKLSCDDACIQSLVLYYSTAQKRQNFDYSLI